MRKFPFLLVISLAFAALAVAQISDDEFKTLMQSNAANVAAIRDATDTASAAPAANKLVDTFTKVAAYWKAKNVPDAVTLPRAPATLPKQSLTDRATSPQIL